MNDNTFYIPKAAVTNNTCPSKRIVHSLTRNIIIADVERKRDSR